MPATYTYPGVYVEEVPSGVRTITGVSTSNTAFIGFFPRGPMDKAARITSFADFERSYGGLDTESEVSYAIQQYYLNGGSVAFLVRVASGSPSPASLTLQGGSPLQASLRVEAANPGEWGRRVRVAVVATVPASDRFNLVVREVTESNGRTRVIAEEVHRNLSMATTDVRYVVEVIAQSSSVISVADAGLGHMPVAVTPNDDGSVPASAFQALTGGSDGNPPDANAFMGSQTAKTGMYALDTIAPEIFNLLCMPAAAELSGGFDSVVSAATQYCEDKRAFYILDIPSSVDTEKEMRDWMRDTGDALRHANAAVYFPRVFISDPMSEFRPRNIAASGTMAGVYARTDAERGVWKAPAGTEAALRGVNHLATKLTDLENGALNPLGVNVLRTFPVFGSVGWGARTLEGADQMASEWKYIPVRRAALFIEESLYQGLKWVVFEPNDEPLWAQIRLNVGAFMQNLFRQGAFQGTTPREAYFVKCDKETTTQNDIDLGIVNIVVGFAPLKPAEFVVIKIQQIAGQVET
jgi:hypothetical protein